MLIDDGARLSRASDGHETGYDQSPRVREDAAGFLPAMVSHAQNFEDVILRRALQDVTHGFYVDVGAWHPVQDSVTAYFYANGWRGINVEPNPQYFMQLEQARTRDTNLACVVGALNGTCLFTTVEDSGLSSGKPGALIGPEFEAIGKSKVITVPSVTLDQLMTLAGTNTIDFLKIDVEGMERDILNAATFASHRPRILIVEATQPMTQIPNHQDWEPQLLALGFEFALFDGLNRFYVRREDAWRKSILSLPPCVFDNFFSPTIAAQIAPLGARIAELDDRYQAALTGASQAEVTFSEAIGRLEAELLRSEEQRSAAIGVIDELRQQLDAAVARNALIEAEMASLEERCREAVRLEALSRDELAASVEIRQHLEAEAARNAQLEAELANSEERCRDAVRAEAMARVELNATADIRQHLDVAVARNAVIEAELASSEERYRDAVRDEAVAREGLTAAAATIMSLQRDLLHAEDRRAAAAGAEQAKRQELDTVIARSALTEAELARSLDRCRDAIQGEAMKREELTAAIARITSLDEALELARDEAAAWKEAGSGSPVGDLVPFPFRLPGLGGIYCHFLLRKARQAMRQQDWRTAARNFRAVLASDRNQPYVWVEYGHALKESGEFGDAARAYRQVLLGIPNHPDIGQHLAFVNRILREHDGRDLGRPHLNAESPAGLAEPSPETDAVTSDSALRETNPTRQLSLIARDIRLAR